MAEKKKICFQTFMIRYSVSLFKVLSSLVRVNQQYMNCSNMGGSISAIQQCNHVYGSHTIRWNGAPFSGLMSTDDYTILWSCLEWAAYGLSGQLLVELEHKIYIWMYYLGHESILFLCRSNLFPRDVAQQWLYWWYLLKQKHAHCCQTPPPPPTPMSTLSVCLFLHSISNTEFLIYEIISPFIYIWLQLSILI